MEIRRSYDRLISTMGFPILVRSHLYIESRPSYHVQMTCSCKTSYSRWLTMCCFGLVCTQLCMFYRTLRTDINKQVNSAVAIPPIFRENLSSYARITGTNPCTHCLGHLELLMGCCSHQCGSPHTGVVFNMK